MCLFGRHAPGGPASLCLCLPGIDTAHLLLHHHAQVYASNACQIIPPADAAIAAAIEAELPLWALPPLDEVASYRQPVVRDPLPGVADRYYSALKQRLHHRSAEANAAAPAMAYTALHGVGTPWLLRAFSEWGLPPPILTPRQCEPDPDFSTGVDGQAEMQCAWVRLRRFVHLPFLAHASMHWAAPAASPRPPAAPLLQSPSPIPRKARARGSWRSWRLRRRGHAWPLPTTPMPTALRWLSRMA